MTGFRCPTLGEMFCPRGFRFLEPLKIKMLTGYILSSLKNVLEMNS